MTDKMTDKTADKKQKNKAPIQLGAACDEAKATISGARQDTYGAPEDSFAWIAAYWNIYIRQKRGVDPKLDPLDVALLMDLFKTARCSGQAFSRDNYIDKIGYTTIACDRIIPGQQAKKLTGYETALRIAEERLAALQNFSNSRLERPFWERFLIWVRWPWF